MRDQGLNVAVKENKQPCELHAPPSPLSRIAYPASAASRASAAKLVDLHRVWVVQIQFRLLRFTIKKTTQTLPIQDCCLDPLGEEPGRHQIRIFVLAYARDGRVKWCRLGDSLVY